ncbi:MAG: T9SS type A sorting domain-containing protein [Bacteroidia bacterium]|nr:T9SS type A sorting domain-containing protein [Bacteroidia bacterium]
MKKQLTILITGLLMATLSLAQTVVSVRDIQYISPTDLADCKDLSSYDDQEIKTIGIVMHDGNLTELASGSVNGGYRPGVHILDTSSSGMGNFRGVQIHGVYTDGGGQSQPVSKLDNLVSGMIIEVTGKVGNFQGETQVFPLDNSSVKVIGSVSAPTAEVIDLGKLNDNTRSNIYVTGEEWEGSFVQFNNVTVVSVSVFSGNRVSFDVSDENGNVINVSDRFLVQKIPGRTLVNPSSPQNDGEFVAPIVGTKYESLKGIIMHSQNGCSGGTGRGYELNPFDKSHYKVGDTPPSITEVTRIPLVPSSSDNLKISAKIIDFNGTVDNQKLYYTDDTNKDNPDFTETTLTLKAGSTDEYEGAIPAFADGTIIKYYISATDNDGNVSYSPFSASKAKGATAFYTVRDGGLTIPDLQYVLDPTSDASPYKGQTVTVRGYVTSSAKPYDLEDVYIQDKDAKEWGGIRISGSSDLLELWRTEEVEVTGTIEESFGFTQMLVSSVTKTGNKAEIAPIELPVSDSAGRVNRGMEKYEGMLVRMVNQGGKVKISNPRLNPFGEWMISSDTGASFNNSTKVQTGVKNGNNNSSLWVSVVSDDTLENIEGIMEVPAIEATKEMDMDAIVGVIYYGFSQYSLKPRNNDDIIGFSLSLESTNYAGDTATNSIIDIDENGFIFYPNPSSDVLNVTTRNLRGGTLYIRSIEGREMMKTPILDSKQLNIDSLIPGIYMLEFIDSDGIKMSAKFIKI